MFLSVTAIETRNRTNQICGSLRIYVHAARGGGGGGGLQQAILAQRIIFLPSDQRPRTSSHDNSVCGHHAHYM